MLCEEARPAQRPENLNVKSAHTSSYPCRRIMQTIEDLSKSTSSDPGFGLNIQNIEKDIPVSFQLRWLARKKFVIDAKEKERSHDPKNLAGMTDQ